jgi:hypothetical protein
MRNLMTSCRACGAAIARNASICPYCGRQRTAMVTVVMAWFFGIFILGLFIAALSGSGDKPLTPAEQAAKKKADPAVQRAVLGARKLKHAARNPDSFVLTQALIMPDGSACLEYRARNGFGGTTWGQAVVTRDGRLRTNYNSWNEHCADKTGEDDTPGIALMAR